MSVTVNKELGRCNLDKTKIRERNRLTTLPLAIIGYYYLLDLFHFLEVDVGHMVIA